MLLNCIAVGLGGALGAVLRYLLSLIPVRGAIPVTTLLTNVLGAFAIGCIAGAMEGCEMLSARWTLFGKAGVCGGFTTFSTFSLETLTLLENHHIPSAAGYAALSVTLCVLGVWAGRTAVLWMRRHI